jgi:1-aminocyclopropane-1-carboxylate deaminase
MISTEVSLSVPMNEITSPLFERAGISVNVLRCDLINPISGGNKWYKLRLNLEEAAAKNIKTLLSFGGAYSNHLAALAQMGRQFGYKTIGIVRGEMEAKSNITLQRAAFQGMELVFTDRESYRKYRDEKAWTDLHSRFGPCFIIPEGGSNHLGVQGCMKIADQIPLETDEIFLPVGTGATLAGLVLGLNGRNKVTGIAVVKAEQWLKTEILRFLSDERVVSSGEERKSYSLQGNYSLNSEYTFGGYAKRNEQLERFVEDFNANQPFKIEPVYSGKLWYGLTDMIEKGKFRKGTKIVVVHTGGLQYLHS